MGLTCPTDISFFLSLIFLSFEKADLAEISSLGPECYASKLLVFCLAGFKVSHHISSISSWNAMNASNKQIRGFLFLANELNKQALMTRGSGWYCPCSDKLMRRKLISVEMKNGSFRIFFQAFSSLPRLFRMQLPRIALPCVSSDKTRELHLALRRSMADAMP